MRWWDTIAETVEAEFSDVNDLAQLTRIIVRLLLAALLGFALGYEREHKGKAAGARTHMLVAIGSALFILVPQQSAMTPDGLTRVIQGLLAGVGFLCAGSILKAGRDETQVTGLTTAAGLWTTAAIGQACGLGREVTAVISTVLALVVLALVPHFTRAVEMTIGGPKASSNAPANTPDDRD